VDCRVGLVPESIYFSQTLANLKRSHDVDDQGLRQIDIYVGRGLLIESTAGNIWLFVLLSQLPIDLLFPNFHTCAQVMSETDIQPPGLEPDPSTTLFINTSLQIPRISTWASLRLSRPTTSQTHLLPLLSQSILDYMIRTLWRAVRGSLATVEVPGD